MQDESTREGESVSKRYIVFERPEGSKCWTIAMVDNYRLPASFQTSKHAERFVSETHSKRLGWSGGKPNQTPMQSHIAEVELPE